MPSNKAVVVLAWSLSGRGEFLPCSLVLNENIFNTLLNSTRPRAHTHTPIRSSRLSPGQLSRRLSFHEEKLRSLLNKLSRRVARAPRLIKPGVEMSRDILCELSPEWHRGSGTAMLTRSAESRHYLNPLSISFSLLIKL